MSGYCVICYEGFSATAQNISAVLCGHTFHQSCLTNWTAKSKTCPQCRLPINAKSVIPKLYFNASPDPQDDPEVLKMRNAQLTVELRHRTEQVDHMKRAADVQETIVHNLRKELCASESGLRVERSLSDALKTQMKHISLTKNHAIDQLQTQLTATRKSLHEAEERQKCFEDMLYGYSDDAVPPLGTCDSSSTTVSKELLQPCYSILNFGFMDTNDSIQGTNSHSDQINSVSDQLKVPTTNSAEKDTNPQLADKETCDLYTAYQLSSMAGNLQLLAAADQELDRLFGFTQKETDESESSKRDGSTEESAIIID